MTTWKVLSTVAAIALLAPMAIPTESHAQDASVRRGAAAPHMGGGGGQRVGGGGGGGQRFSGGGGGGAAPMLRSGGGGGQRFVGNGGGGQRFVGGGGDPSGGQRFNGGGRRFVDGGDRGRGRAFIPGIAAGVAIGGVLGSQGYYDSGSYAYDPQYYNDGAVVDGDVSDGVVAVVPGGGDIDYCIQTYRSYDVRSQTYMGNDGYRHSCP